MLWHAIPKTPSVGYTYLNLLLFIDMTSSLAVLVKLSELKHSVVMQRWDCQNLLLNYLITILNNLIIQVSHPQFLSK
jgi:hypothetical protein